MNTMLANDRARNLKRALESDRDPGLPGALGPLLIQNTAKFGRPH